ARLSRATESEGRGSRGSQNRKGARAAEEASQTPDAARTPKECRDNEQYRKRNQTNHYLAGGGRSNAVNQSHRRYRTPFGRERWAWQSGNCKCVARKLGHRPESLQVWVSQTSN